MAEHFGRTTIMTAVGCVIAIGCLPIGQGARAAPPITGGDAVEICEALPGDVPIEGWIAPAAHPVRHRTARRLGGARPLAMRQVAAQ